MLPFMGRRGLGSFKRRPVEKTEVEWRGERSGSWGGNFFLAGVLWCWGADPESRLLLVLLGDWSVGALPSSVQQGPGKRPSTRSPRAVAPLAGEKERHLKKNAT